MKTHMNMFSSYDFAFNAFHICPYKYLYKYIHNRPTLTLIIKMAAFHEQRDCIRGMAGVS
jgi:hypothetical protein